MDFIGLSVLIVLLLLFAFLSYRAFMARRLWVKLLAGIPAALLTLLFGAATVLAFVGYNKLNRTLPNPVPNLSVAATTPQLLAHGEKFARTCAGCHSSNGQLPLTGQNFIAEGPPIGTLYAPNLTQAHFQNWSDGEIIRAVREGVHKDGRSLIIMPSKAFHTLSDEDALALVAYLRSQPADAPDTPARNISVLGAMMFATVLPDEMLTAQAPITAPITAPPAGRTIAYGNYILGLGCRECHGNDLKGAIAAGPVPEEAPSLIAFAQQHTLEAFISTLRTGIKPDGTLMSEGMPWQDLEKLTDDDLGAMYLYLKAQ